MHSKHELWPTEIYQTEGNLDTDKLFEACKQHQQKNSTVTLSNRGGYQGHYFNDSDFVKTVVSNIPSVPNKPLPDFAVQAWVNLNGPGHWNTLHNHLDEQVLISGIYYVRCPANSGDLYFYDPRYLSTVGTHYRYYCSPDGSGIGGYVELKPRENLLLFFPPSLYHMVGPNMSDQERCSIAFNILVKPKQGIKQ